MISKRILRAAGTAALMILLIAVTADLFGDIDGRTGRTRKTSTSGCGGCHGSSATLGVSVTINGPDTVVAGQTNQFSMVITRSGKTGAGIDIATRRGSLGTVTSGTRVSGGEITHNDNLLMNNGTVTVLFNYIAPATEGPDTIWSTGVATNTGGNSSGDEWNWSANRRVYVKLATGVNVPETFPGDFSLSQNFPNPFNPVTTIGFRLPVQSNVKLSVYDAEGRMVAGLINEKRQPGNYSVTFSGEDLPSGVYFCRINAGDFSDTRRMMLVK